MVRDRVGVKVWECVRMRTSIRAIIKVKVKVRVDLALHRRC